LTENNDCSVDIIFYIRTRPEICMERLLKRNRLEEIGTVNLDYLENIHKYHDDWLLSQSLNNEYLAPKVILIDGDQSLEMVLNGIERGVVECLKEENGLTY